MPHEHDWKTRHPNWDRDEACEVWAGTCPTMCWSVSMAGVAKYVWLALGRLYWPSVTLRADVRSIGQGSAGQEEDETRHSY
jgi:hypothetical protein